MRVLLIQTGFIGDVILSTPVFSRAKDIYPNAKVDLLTTKVAADLFEQDDRFDRVIVYDKRGEDGGISGFLRILFELRKQNYNSIITLHKSIRTSLLVYLTRAKNRLGFKEASLNYLFNKSSARSDLSHEVLRNLAIYRAVGREPEPCPMQLSYSATVNNSVEKLIAKYTRPIVGIAPGSVWATKRWTMEGFAEVAKDISNLGYQVLLIGGLEDKESADSIISNTANCENLCGKLSLAESACLISKLKVLICNDSSPLHMASAAQTPVIALFCATVPEFGFGPWMVPSRVLGVEGLDCRPCGRHGGNTCPTGTHFCQLQLKSTQVLAAFKDLLAELLDSKGVNENLHQ